MAGWLDKSTGASDGWVFWDDTSINFFGRGLSDTTVNVTGNLNEWQHIIVTYDGSNLKMYLNNSLADDDPSTGTVLPSVGDLWMGRYHHDDSYSGMKIDELGIWNRTITATERSHLFNNTAYNQLTVITPTLVAPSNDTQIIDTTFIDFESSATVFVGNITNATLYV